MIVYKCDGCGRKLSKNALRYTVSIDVRAAYNEIEVGLAELVRDHRQEILALIEQLKHRDPREVEEQVYKRITLDLCPACHAAFIRDPLRFHPEQGNQDAEIDIDGFLRSLGFGENSDADPEA